MTYIDNLKQHNNLIDEIVFDKYNYSLKNDTNNPFFSIDFLIPDISYNSIAGNLNNTFYIREKLKEELDKVDFKTEKLFFNNFSITIRLYIKEELTVDLDNLTLVSFIINKYVIDYFKGSLYFDDKTLIKIDFQTINNHKNKEKKHRLSLKIN